ncbi:hypothetical protein M569_17533, partial [Genlisea aurea]
PSCMTHCGDLRVKYPFGTGPGCGSPQFSPYIACSQNGDRLLLNTHHGSYPIDSIFYSNSTMIVAPSSMSNCRSMQRSSSYFGLEWGSPFQLGPSTFILLACSSYSVKGNPICEPGSSNYLCDSIYACPSVVDLGLPLFPATNTCCVYSPADLGPRDELDLRELKCGGYSSVVGLGDVPSDPEQWVYGVALKYATGGGLGGYNIPPSCSNCEMSGGACGYAPKDESFLCVCEYGNTSTDCYSYGWTVASPS